MTARPDAPSADPTQWRFRRLLALYPAHWQADNGDAMLGVMLDAAEAEGRTGPTVREAVSTLGHAVTQWRSRLVARRQDDGVLGSFAGLGPAAVVSGGVLSVLSLWFAEFGPALTGAPSVSGPDPLPGVATTGVIVFAAWLVALVAALAGRPGPARQGFAVAAAMPAVVAVMSAVTGLPSPRAGLLGALTVFAVVGAVMWPDASRRLRFATGAAVVIGSTVSAAQVVHASAGLPFAAPAWRFVGDTFYSFYGLAQLGGIATAGTVAALAVGLVLLWHRPGVLVTAVVIGGPWLVLTHAGIWAPGPGVWLLRPSDLLAFGALLCLPLTLGLMTTAARLHRHAVRR
ncbi:MAG: hypothetical protein HY830_00860 [Actinobacteria bacterium]|nr:hypothetical protein [Actinomycetota bacterium]